MLKNILLVGLGGFFGSIARYLVFLLIDKRWSTAFPLSTFTVNIVGSLILGFFAGMLIRHHFTESARFFIAVGFCGSFTTFSTFAYENMQLLWEKPWMAAIYIIASLSVGLGMVFLGYHLGRNV
ncbi:fluoride efflux transporter CrcB [Fulvivirga sp. RKSG066]|uniref:fluoride efflux transporter CrcB n=1 Tax=Fulvivirga aurantia TaxID=2529383 RepID=UPI0012BBF768|nr:fluoride efflux transporter CrcB [Fulvivirga aurantia]MTI21283.1 fluoride efflux transporter CrcB [Fulvivirga aurantia]